MNHRIGSLHLRYRVRGSSMDAALTPGLDRAIQIGLADAVDARLHAMFGDDPSVIVVRELQTAVALNAREVMLDSRVVERVCASSVDALGRMLAHTDSSESLIRFADQAEFVGSFIVDLIEGFAWDHWYYGAFRRYWSADAGETIRVVLTDCGVDPARVLAWLQRRGKLDAVLRLLAPEEALALVDPLGRRSGEAPDDFVGADVLADAALQLLAALGWQEIATSRRDLIAPFLASQPIVAHWTDRQSLSTWVLALIRFVTARAPSSATRIGSALPNEVRNLLTGSLDWLDGPWLIDELSALASGVTEPRSVERERDRPLLSARQSRILASVALRLRDGRVRVPTGIGESELIVRLIAAVTMDSGLNETLDRTLVAAIEEIARSAVRMSVHSAASAHDASADDARSMDAPTSFAHRASISSSPLEALSRYGSVASELLQALQAVQSAPDEESQLTEAGGLFLLLRALIDTRLPALARHAGVPLPPLLGTLATKWFGVRAPFDSATALWVGAESPDSGTLASRSAELRALQGTLLDTLIARHVLDATDAAERIEADARLLTAELPCSCEVDAALSRIASLLTRAWSHWLRGIAHSSTPFLLEHCLQRAARVRITDTRVAIDFDPAPLDVVLQMAGYFARIDAVPWLGERSVAFTVRRAP